MAQLIGKDVTLGYEGNVVIEHLNFSVQAGDYLYIVGENGSGKSTLMKAILGLKSPMAGTIIPCYFLPPPMPDPEIPVSDKCLSVFP